MDPSKSHDQRRSQSSNKPLSNPHDELLSHHSSYSESPNPSSYNETSWANKESAFLPLAKPFDEEVDIGPPYPQHLALGPYEEEPQHEHRAADTLSSPRTQQQAKNKSENSKHRNDPKHHAHVKAPKHKSRRTQQISAHASSQADSTRAHASASTAAQSRQGAGHAQAHASLGINDMRSSQLQSWLDEPVTQSSYHGYESFDGGKES